MEWGTGKSFEGSVYDDRRNLEYEIDRAASGADDDIAAGGSTWSRDDYNREAYGRPDAEKKWTVKSDGIPGGAMETPYRKEAVTTAISASLRGENHAASVFQWNPAANKSELAAVYTEGRPNLPSNGLEKRRSLGL